ncbi:hypothetical protein DSO57_1006481 [Entomophthora muscae]|uniref:Uncharacterized protein n=1 Tax=Entomophthora muscae TaxID=34485 RepID=A0ACC2RMD4_9FUNG|nr:hypothetical protein DSO57_1006481 [Entomophthora muscae]
MTVQINKIISGDSHCQGLEFKAWNRGGQGPLQTALDYLGSLKQPEAGSCPGASFNDVSGELAAPSGIGAPSPNALNGLGASKATLNQIFWVLQQIFYQTDLLQNSTSRSENFQIPAAASAAPHTVVPPTPNQSNCTDVLVSHLAATEDAVDATNKLVDNSTSVKLQDSEILAVNN